MGNIEKRQMKFTKIHIFLDQDKQLNEIAIENDSKKAILIRKAIDMFIEDYRKKQKKK